MTICPHCMIRIVDPDFYDYHVERCFPEPELTIEVPDNVSKLPITLTPSERTKAVEDVIDKWIDSDAIDQFMK